MARSVARRPRNLCAVRGRRALALGVAGLLVAWAGVAGSARAWLSAPSGSGHVVHRTGGRPAHLHLTARQASSSGNSGLGSGLSELYIADASPKGRQVQTAYRQLKSLSGDDQDKVAEIMRELDSDQKSTLKALMTAIENADKPVTSSKPELGDTAFRLYKRMQLLENDEAIIEWRANLDQPMLQEVQYIIEVEQMKLADAEAARGVLEDEAEAQDCYDIFKRQYPVPAERETYMTTPCRVADIKYRFRRFKASLGIDSATALAIFDKETSPLFVDPDFIRRTWNVMAATIGKEDALVNLVMKNPGSLISNPQKVEEMIGQMKTVAIFTDAFSGVGKWLREQVSDNGRRTPFRVPAELRDRMEAEAKAKGTLPS